LRDVDLNRATRQQPHQEEDHGADKKDRENRFGDASQEKV
jgi:hypothetical protein